MKKILPVFVFTLFTINLFAQQVLGPLPPKKVYPVDSAVNVNVNTVLDWNALAGVDFYEVEIDTTDSFNSPLLRYHQNAYISFTNNGTDTEFQVPGLLPSTTYYWTVRVQSGGIYSSFGVYWHFTTQASTGISSLPDVSEVLISYNTNSKTVLVNTTTQSFKGTCVLFNQVGQAVKNVNIDMDNSTISVNDISKGVYFLKVQFNNSVITKKIFIY